MQPATEASRLRYLNASQVESPVGELRDMVFRSPTDEKVGKLDGIIIDPLERRVCYYVVQSGNWLRRSRYLLPAVPAPIEPARKAVRVDLEPDALQQCARFSKAAFRPFSDDDLIEALFPVHVA